MKVPWLIAIFSLPIVAQEVPFDLIPPAIGETAPGRFVVVPADSGKTKTMMRVDTATGAVWIMGTQDKVPRFIWIPVAEVGEIKDRK